MDPHTPAASTAAKQARTTRRPRNIRKRDSDWAPGGSKAEAANSPASTSKDEPSSLSVEDLLDLQQIRRKGRQPGLDIDALSHGSNNDDPGHKKKKPKRSESARKPVEHAETKTLDGLFTVQTNKLDANKHMMEYIEQRMKGKATPPASNSSACAAAPGPANPATANDLYQVPAHLRIVDAKPVNEGNVAMASKMLSSIPEVDLGSEAKIKNALATDKVVRSMDGRRPDANARTRDALRGPRATDDIVFRRFKKRMRR